MVTDGIRGADSSTGGGLVAVFGVGPAVQCCCAWFALGVRTAEIKSFLAALVCVAAMTMQAAPLEWRAGDWWRSFPRSLRAAYLEGVLDGLVVIPALTGDPVNGDRRMNELHQALPKMFQGMDEEKIAYGLDAFYSERKNRGIPVGVAVMYLVIDRSGLPDAEKRSTLKELRSKSR